MSLSWKLHHLVVVVLRTARKLASVFVYDVWMRHADVGSRLLQRQLLPKMIGVLREGELALLSPLLHVWCTASIEMSKSVTFWLLNSLDDHLFSLLSVYGSYEKGNILDKLVVCLLTTTFLLDKRRSTSTDVTTCWVGKSKR